VTIEVVLDPSQILGLALAEQSRALAIVAGLRRCPVVLSHARITLGAFTVDRHSGATEIRISRHLTDPEQVKETARHEFAHQAAWERYAHFGHGPLWQTFASYLGCEPVRCARVDPSEPLEARYAITCRRCGWTTTRVKRSKLVTRSSRYRCSSCGGRLRVDVLTKE
jgi:predicted SprT family Zn-dependent metalloprotease